MRAAGILPTTNFPAGTSPVFFELGKGFLGVDRQPCLKALTQFGQAGHAGDYKPIQITEIENWMWKNKKIRIRGGAPSKIRLSTPYYLLRKDVDRYLAAFDEYKKDKTAA